MKAKSPAATEANISMPATSAEEVEPSMDDKTLSEKERENRIRFICIWSAYGMV